MWMSQEDARSDFVLAAAAVVFGPLVIGFLAQLPFYPGGLVGELLLLGWLFVATALTPILLTRYRELGWESYGLSGDRSAWTIGLRVAAPIVLVGWLRGWLGLQNGPIRALLGRLGNVVGNPVIGEGAGGLSFTDLLFELAFVALLFLCGLVLIGFLVTRARDAFRRNELPLVEAVRTFGMGAAAAALVIGLLASLGRRVSFSVVLMNVAAMVAVVLLTDRLVDRGDETSRATLLAPAVVGLILQIMNFGGFFGGDLLSALFFGSMSGGLIITVAALVETRRAGWAIVPVAAAAALFPTCLTLPVAFNASLVGGGCG